MIQSTYKPPVRRTRTDLSNTLGPKALQLAHDDAVKYIRRERPTWSYDMASSVAWDIIRKIDWNNSALMHKSLDWIVCNMLKQLCPKE